MRIIRAESYPAVPWKNGLGITREILRHPDRAADFHCRLSIAEVSQSCDFSAFPGYDRTIMLLAGGGFELRFADGRSHALTARHAPFHFDGGAAVSCIVAGGPSQDLNLMVRKDAAKADCGVMDIAGRLVLPKAPGTVRLMVSLADRIVVRAGGEAATLGQWDTVFQDAAGGQLGEAVCEAAAAPLFHAVIAVRAVRRNRGRAAQATS